MLSRGGDINHRQEGDDSLAGSNISLKQPEHPLARSQIGSYLGECALLSPCKRKRQGRLDGPGGLRRWDDRSREAPLSLFAFRESQLMGQEFVIGESAPCGRVSGKVRCLRGSVKRPDG